MITIKFVSLDGAKRVTLKDGCTVQEALAVLGFGEEKISNTRLNGIPASLNSILHDGELLSLIPGLRGEATFKIAGDVWRFHQNDPDENFPSDLHAHNLVRPETLDIYTGSIYDARNRHFQRKMKSKHLNQLRRLLNGL